MLFYYKISLTLAALWVIPLLLLQITLTFAVISLTSAAHVNFRDMGHALPLVVQLWMFATPVAYPISVIPGWLRPYYLLNPMAGIIEGYRNALVQKDVIAENRTGGLSSRVFVTVDGLAKEIQRKPILPSARSSTLSTTLTAVGQWANGDFW
jgi:ABC-type polysaccharide/polyol phosphate export permease